MLRFSIDPTKRGDAAEIHVEPPYELVGLFIDSDLRSAYGTREELDALRAVAAGEREPSERTGNGFALVLGRETCVVESLYSEPEWKVEVPTADLIRLLEQWLTYFLQTYGDDSPKPTN